MNKPVPPPALAAELDLEALWMPFTHNRFFKKEPRIVVAAEGMHYTTADGRQILDGLSGLWCCNAGHRHPAIVSAVKAQLDRSPQYSQEMLDPLRGQLAKVIAKLTPGELQYGFFANSGTEAVDGAMKLAKLYTGRRGFISTTGGFHGKSLGALSLFDFSLIDAARTLGCSYPKAILRVLVPGLGPAFLTSGMFAFLASMDNYPISIFFTDAWTKTLPIQMLQYVEENPDPTIAAISAGLVLLAILALIVGDRLVGLRRMADF